MASKRLTNKVKKAISNSKRYNEYGRKEIVPSILVGTLTRIIEAESNRRATYLAKNKQRKRA